MKEKVLIQAEISLDVCYKIVAEDLLKKALLNNDSRYESVVKTIIEILQNNNHQKPQSSTE